MADLFVIDDGVKQRLEELRAFAEDNMFSTDDLLDIFYGKKDPPGDDERFTCIIPVDNKVVFSVDDHPSLGIIRHLSMSTRGRRSNPFTVREVIQMLGFENELEDCIVQVAPECVHVIEQVEQ